MALTESISLLAMIVSLFALMKSFYTNSEWEAKRKGRDIVEITYSEVGQDGKKKSYFMDKTDEPLEFYMFHYYLMVKNPNSNYIKIIKMEDLDTIISS